MDDIIYEECYKEYLDGTIRWDEKAKKFGYGSKEEIRGRFRRKREKRGDPSVEEYRDKINSGEFNKDEEDFFYRETVETKEDGRIYSDRLIEIESLDLKNPEKLLKAHGFDPSEWVLVSSINNYWNGLRPKDRGKVTLYQSKILVRPKIQTDLTFSDIDKFFSEFTPASFSKFSDLRQYKSGGLVLEFDLADAHVGNESLPFEDLKQRVVNLVYEIKDRCKGLLIEKIYLVQLGDIFHFDNYARQTTGGTQVTYGSGFHNMYTSGMELMIWVIEELLKISKVEVISIYGNHDKINSYTLAKTIEAYFRNNENVVVDTCPDDRKFRKIGVSSVAFVHGDMPKSNIHDTFQKEARKLFGETIYSEIHLGHLHHEISLEKSGVILRYLPSITVPDEWHKKNGYTGSKQGTHCFLWDLERGLTDIWMIPVH